MEQIINLLEAANIAYVASQNEIRIKLAGWKHNIIIGVAGPIATIGTEIGSGENYQYMNINKFEINDFGLTMLMIEIQKMMNG